MSKVAVFGAGSWGTAFSVVLADAGNDVTSVGPPRGALRDDQREAREHRLPARHRAARRRSRATHDPGEALTAPRSSCSRCRRRPSAATSTDWADIIPPDALLVSLMKGVELGR